MPRIRCKMCDFVQEIPAELPTTYTPDAMYPFAKLYLHMTRHGIVNSKLKKCFHEVEE